MEKLYLIENILEEGTRFIICKNDNRIFETKDYEKAKQQAEDIANSQGLQTIERKIDVCFVITIENGQDNKDLIIYEVMSNGQCLTTTRSRYVAETMAYSSSFPGYHWSKTIDLRKSINP